MFKGHPKGLFVLALANMGERFGYYTMLAIFALYLQAKFGLSAGKTSIIYSTFLACVYFLPLLGGIIADRALGYIKTILIGIFVMFFGYFLLAYPSQPDTFGYIMMFTALAFISLGTGFFKGNLQALVGKMYDDPKYSSKRDMAFSIFYMCINIGAFFAPSAAEMVSNKILAKDGFKYEAKVPDLSFKYLNYKVADSTAFKDKVVLQLNEKGKKVNDVNLEIKKAKNKEGIIFYNDSIKINNQLTTIGQAQLGNRFISSKLFAGNYIKSLSRSYSWGFAVACFSLIISLGIFIFFRKHYNYADVSRSKDKKDVKSNEEELTPEQTRERLIALGLVFIVVIFFWMAFHQNGLCLTFFARDYTNLHIGPLFNLSFSLYSLIPLIIGFFGLLMIFQNKEMKKKMAGAALTVLSVIAVVYYYYYSKTNNPEIIEKGFISITPPIFQQFNPYFIVLLTPLFLAYFSWLNSKGKEPSAPKKIAIGMFIAAVGFIIMMTVSFGLKSPSELGGAVSDSLVSPLWLMNTYFVLTIAEIFISPMGISFVSRVAPPKYKGSMQGGWFAATAIGNYLVGVVGIFWLIIPLWALWGILVLFCVLSAIFIVSILKRLERVTK
ncbi:MAG: peptide MFS transporter [Bacteroidales bacterium]|nr:peptide MFS transporter [Bacteroidales bacterium]